MDKTNQFGFRVTADRQICFDSQSRALYLKILEGEPTIRNCISCGTCAATCPVSAFTNHSLRRAILLIRRGLSDVLSAEIAKCMLCGKCQLVCPRNVNTRNLLLQIKREIHHKTDI